MKFQQSIDLLEEDLHWYDSAQQLSQLHPAAVAELKNPNSLTSRVKQFAAGSFQLHVHQENWRILPDLQLRQQFGPLANSHQCWSRQVSLWGKEQPWILAHSLMPAHAQLSQLGELLALGDKPLGGFLFDHPDLIRANLQFTCTESGLWGRRSVFFLFRKPILVAEFFTPAYLSIAATEPIDKARDASVIGA